MLEKLKDIEKAALAAISACKDTAALQEIKIAYLGKKGELTQILRGIGQCAAEERAAAGAAVNQVKEYIEQAIEQKMTVLTQAAEANRLAAERIDVTLPGKKITYGHKHILTSVREEIEDIFIGLGYEIAEGPEVELDYYNFEAMNMPPDHPARDMQDSFYFSNNLVLRTHTSPMQARTMEKVAPGLPLKIISPGVVYRRDDDATHSPMFHQVEGLYVDQHVTLAELKGTLLAFARKMFGEEREIRLRPSYFPFTEPSAEVDISCFACGGAGCRLCKGSGWIEILGSGIVHPNVLTKCGYDPEKVSAFAFGMGIERIAILKYGIPDIRLLFNGDMRFLRQF